jgi:hypothetical protein
VWAQAPDSASGSDSGLESEPALAPALETGSVQGLDSQALAESAGQASESAGGRRHPPDQTVLWPEQ